MESVLAGVLEPQVESAGGGDLTVSRLVMIGRDAGSESSQTGLG